MRCFNIMRVDWLLVMITLALGHFNEIVDRVACDFAKDCMLLVQVVRGAKSDEELGAVVVFASVGHGDKTSADETKLKRRLET